MNSYAANPLIFIILTIVSFLQFIMILRFLFEIMRVDFYNPVSQFIFKVTNPILSPLRTLPLSFGKYDLIIIFLIISLTALKLYIPFYFKAFDYSLNYLLIVAFGTAIREILNVFWYAVIIGAIGSWFMAFNRHPIFSLIDQLCEPLYRPIRRIMPQMSGIDFSPIVLLFLIQLANLIIIPPIFGLTQFF